MAPRRQAPRDHRPFGIRHVTCVAQPAALILGTSGFSPWHGDLPRIFANPMESQLAGITRSFFGQALRMTVKHSRLAYAAVRAQEFLAALGDRDPQPFRGGPPRDIAAIDRVLPDRQPRTRRPPGLNHFRI